jgi:hypothetical protein
MFNPNPGSEFFHPGSTSKNLIILTLKFVSQFSEIGYGLFIPDPDPDFLPIPDPGVKKWHRIPDPDPQHFDVHKKYST